MVDPSPSRDAAPGAIPPGDAEPADRSTGTAPSSPGFDCAHCRELDRIAIEEFGIPGVILMEHASLGAALCALQAPAEPPARAQIFCGPGNNGGDGYGIARHLHNAGVDVEVWELTDPARRPPAGDAVVHRGLAQRTGVPLRRAWSEPLDESALTIDADLVVDAIFGTGLARAPEGRFRRVIEGLAGSSAPVLAVDIPSGLDGDRGTPWEVAVRARWTVTFGLPKRGFTVPDARPYTGDVWIVPIGLPRQALPAGIPAFPPHPHAWRSAGRQA